MDGISKEERKEEVTAHRDADTVERKEKLKKYEAAYARRLKVKYFSKKTFNGDVLLKNLSSLSETILRTENVDKEDTCEIILAYYYKPLQLSTPCEYSRERGDVFDLETTVDGEVIKSSRWPCTRSFADPIKAVEDPNGSPSLVAGSSNAPSKKTPIQEAVW